MTLPTLLEAWEQNGPQSDVVRSYRETSLANWEEISLSKRMSGQCLNLYQVLCDTFPICVEDIVPLFNQRFGYRFPRNEVAKRMSSLYCTYRIAGVWGQVRHEATGTIQFLYYPLCRMPDREKPLSAKDKLIQDLRAENEALRLELAARGRKTKVYSVDQLNLSGKGNPMQPGLEIWIVNRHAHEAVPLRPGMRSPPPGEPFVPKSVYDALEAEHTKQLSDLRELVGEIEELRRNEIAREALND